MGEVLPQAIRRGHVLPDYRIEGLQAFKASAVVGERGENRRSYSIIGDEMMQVSKDFLDGMLGDDAALNSWLENTNNNDIRGTIDSYSNTQLETRTLRDWFAGLAMQAQLSRADNQLQGSDLAQHSYLIAYEMMYVRNK